MKTGLMLCLMMVSLTLAPAATAQAPSLDAMQALVVGLTQAGQVITAGVPLTSGDWGTDYITVSHGLRVGSRFAITFDGKVFDDSTPVAACSSQHHGIDVLIVRVASHRNRQVVTWGDPTELKVGDVLFALPRPEIQATYERLRFVHLNLLEWTKDKPEEWPLAWHNVMVGEGKEISRPGFSGSPWVKDGKVYGLHKGRVRPDDTWFEVAETATRVQQCLELLHYSELIPTP